MLGMIGLMKLRIPLAALGAASRHCLAACALRVRPGEGKVRLIPAGEFTAPRGAMAGAGPWRLTPAAAARIIALNQSRSADILIDYEHQVLLSESNGLPVPAAGWINPQSLEFRADGEEPGLYGEVRWVGDAPALIERDQYRYLSPVFPYDEVTGEPLDLLHVALTNFPAIDEPLVAALSARYPNHRFNPQETPEMDLLKKLLEALGLADTASEAEALAGVAALKTAADGAEAQIAALKAKQPPAAEPDPAKFVPVEAMQAMQAQLAALAARVNDDEAGRLIEAAIAEGKLLETQRDWATKLGTSDIAALRAYVDSAPAIAALRGMQSGGESGGEGGKALSAAELAVCKAMGMSPDEYAKVKKES